MFDDDVRDTEPTTPDPLDGFRSFADAVRTRLEAGRAAYGDQSFERAPAELLTEIREELLDVCGWSYVMFERLRRLEERMAALPPEPKAPRVLKLDDAARREVGRLVGAERGR